MRQPEQLMFIINVTAGLHKGSIYIMYVFDQVLSSICLLTKKTYGMGGPTYQTQGGMQSWVMLAVE